MVLGIGRLLGAKSKAKPRPQQPLPRVRWRLESCECVLRYDEIEGADTFVNPMVEHDCGAHGRGLEAAEHFRRALAFNKTWAASRTANGE